MLVRECPGTFGAAGGESGADRSVLGVVPRVEIVELGARDPGDLAGERAPRRAGDARDVGRLGGLVDHVVERVVRAHPLRGEVRCPRRRGAAFSRRRVGQLGEAVLGGVECGEPLGRHARRGALGGEPFELGADEEGLAQLVAGERADANAAVRLERDEPERGEPAQRFADRRAADVEPLGEQLLPEHRARGDRAGDDLVLEDDRDVVGLRRIRHQGGVYDARPRRLGRSRGRRDPDVAAVADDRARRRLGRSSCGVERLAPLKPQLGQASRPQPA